jgi:hypothetical protein
MAVWSDEWFVVACVAALASAATWFLIERPGARRARLIALSTLFAVGVSMAVDAVSGAPDTFEDFWRLFLYSSLSAGPAAALGSTLASRRAQSPVRRAGVLALALGVVISLAYLFAVFGALVVLVSMGEGRPSY